MKIIIERTSVLIILCNHLIDNWININPQILESTWYEPPWHITLTLTGDIGDESVTWGAGTAVAPDLVPTDVGAGWPSFCTLIHIYKTKNRSWPNSFLSHLSLHCYMHTLLADLMSTKVLYPQLNAYHVHWVVDTYNLMLILSCLFSYSIIFCYTSCSYNCSFIVNSGGRMGWGTKKSHFHFASKISFTVIVRLNVENLKKRSTCSFEDLHKHLTWNKIYLYIWGLGLYLPVHLTTWVMIYLCIWRWHEI